MIVADASVVVDFLLGHGSPAGDALGDRLLQREAVAAPHLLDAEVGQVVRRFLHLGDLTLSQARDLLSDLAGLPIQRFPHTPLCGRALQLHTNATFYDALYLALAEILDAPLLTGDEALAAVPGCTAHIEVLPTTP